MKINCFQHVSFETLGQIEIWAKEYGHPVSITRLYANDPLPSIDAFDFLVVMGGPMGAKDDLLFPWMKGEKQLIEKALKKGKMLLGICLGAQLLADVLGAKVYSNRYKEIGWLPIEWLSKNIQGTALEGLSTQNTVFHWHGDTFDLPKGAVQAARSPACENQAFLYHGKAIGLQFHLEMALPNIEAILTQCSSDLIPGPYIQQAPEILRLSPQFLPKLHTPLFRFLDAFTA